MGLFVDENEKYYYKSLKDTFQNFDSADKYSYCLKAFQYNNRYISFISCLLMDADRPFLEEKARLLYIDFKKIDDPELQRRISTLMFIENNRKNFESPEGGKTIMRVLEVIQYVVDNYDIIKKTPQVMEIDIDIDYAVRQALSNPEFHFSDPKNKVRKFWEKTLKTTLENYKVQELS